MFAELLCAYLVLKTWKNNPKLTKREIGLAYDWRSSNLENDKPLTEKEVESKKKFLRENNPKSYFELFPKEI